MKRFLNRNKGIIIFYGLLVLITLAVTNNITIEKISASNSLVTQLADK
ncbi:MAG: hypothetical protein U0K48_05740 [Bacilli bacterium]|nr:hypothetical protein [Bacilli bacterium]